jgi:tellurite resistance protein TerC
LAVPNLSLLGAVPAASSSRDSFAEIDVPPWAWAALVAVIALMLAIDLFRHRDDHEPSMREALGESAVWVACGLAFAVVIALAFGGQAFGEYLSGYLIEKSLSVDNVFVWAILFATLAIPLKYQHRVLFWGIFGALTLRALFIFAGTALIARFWWLLLVFGVFLVFTGFKVIRHRNNEGTAGATRGLGLLRKVMPVTDKIEGHAFFTRIDGRRAATPLLAALVVIELTEIIFAVDSVPAILAVSNEPFLVFASNAFAILGLRAMYFLLANARERFHYLSHALGGILIFVGIKMSISHWYHMDTYVSLAIIAAMLTAAIVFSERRNRAHQSDAEAATSSAQPADVPSPGVGGPGHPHGSRHPSAERG